ncbi:HTH-type transcriptional activator RhaR [bioreactor metagenome]|uniref:HTH-type transcriptional activator RhaR n=1 Tax=bioreactor metagenome TaxID=1076179 RepID=A0A645FE43_9ZZZZ
MGSQNTQEKLLCEHLEQKQFDETHLLLEHMLNAIIDENNRTAIRIYELIVILNRKALEKVSVPPCYPLWERLLAISDDEDQKQFALHYLQKIIDRLITDEVAYNQTWPQDIIDYIKVEYKNNITLEDAARRVGFSTYYFSRLFKQKFDKSFIEYLTQMRLQNAKQLLSTPGVSVKNVCYSVGYSEPNYFARVFKRETGMSPSKFQKKALKLEE